MSNIPAWKSIIVILSDVNIPGENKHEIMDFCVHKSFQNLKTNHALFSGDTDVMLFNLTMHSNNIRRRRGRKRT